MTVPKNITREDVLKAIADLDAGIQHRWGKSRKFDLVHKGKDYSPKAVAGLAYCHSKRCDQFAIDFSGGKETNTVLKNLGFEIVEKNPSDET